MAYVVIIFLSTIILSWLNQILTLLITGVLHGWYKAVFQSWPYSSQFHKTPCNKCFHCLIRYFSLKFSYTNVQNFQEKKITASIQQKPDLIFYLALCLTAKIISFMHIYQYWKCIKCLSFRLRHYCRNGKHNL